ncbi:MAG TPA: isoprenylcysteine carboxylmethyltransferase family protein [Nocardioidaceae bacterium]|nr:isoprenylcysteine carboxylmethyltransferase family protein [Nocardioidaceae bacterium]
MNRVGAAIGSFFWLLAAPGIVAVLVPWWLTGWDAREMGDGWLPVRVLGAVGFAAGAVVVIEAFGRFAIKGLGTPAPAAPTQHLVVTGLYRYLRNPMYVAVVAMIVGQAMLLGRIVLLGYAAFVALVFLAFVKGYEEPTLRRQFGADYDAYSASVPAWWPRRPKR